MILQANSLHDAHVGAHHCWKVEMFFFGGGTLTCDCCEHIVEQQLRK
jgi:hypothetical protein